MPDQFSVDDALDLGIVSSVAWNDDGSRVGYLLFDEGRTRFAHVSVPDGTAVETDQPPVGGEAVDLGTDDDAAESADDEPPEASTFDWRPDAPDEVAVVAGGDVHLVEVASDDGGADGDGGGKETGPTSRVLSAADSEHASIAWLDADRLVYLRDGAPWLHDLSDGSVRRLDMGEARTSPFGAAPLEVSPDDRHLLVLAAAEDGPGSLVAYDLDDDAVAWEWSPDPADGEVVAGYGWVAPGHLVAVVDATDASRREFRSVRLDADDGAGVALLSETADVVTAQPVVEATDDGRFACISSRTGYAHVYAVDAEARRASVESAGGAGAGGGGGDADPGFEGAGVVQVTSGAFEARGDATDSPSWSPDGDRLAYVTNEADPGERRLHVARVDPAAGEVGEPAVADEPGNVVHPTWASGADGEGTDGRGTDGVTGGIACIRAGRATAANVHVADPDDLEAGSTRLTDVGPDGTGWFPQPEPVSFEGTGGLTVHGYLYTPPGAGAGDDRPAVVWGHGGPIRQMRRGFHHMRSYGYFHAFNHVLVSRGYVVLELNYRGGIGYGHEFETGLRHALGEDDVDDCVRAADWLRDRPEVGDRIGWWGLSYGGFLANAVATKTDAYDCAVNVAGIWDWRDWVEYAAGLGWGAGRRFAAMFGGYPGDAFDRRGDGNGDGDAEGDDAGDDDDETVAERYATASPCEFREELDTPLYSLHGTDDPNVPFDQLDGLVSDLVADGTPFEQAYYPEEDHMFRDPATWHDALGRVLPWLDEHLQD